MVEDRAGKVAVEAFRFDQIPHPISPMCVTWPETSLMIRVVLGVRLHDSAWGVPNGVS